MLVNKNKMIDVNDINLKEVARTVSTNVDRVNKRLAERGQTLDSIGNSSLNDHITAIRKDVNAINTQIRECEAHVSDEEYIKIVDERVYYCNKAMDELDKHCEYEGLKTCVNLTTHEAQFSNNATNQVIGRDIIRFGTTSTQLTTDHLDYIIDKISVRLQDNIDAIRPIGCCEAMSNICAKIWNCFRRD